MRLPAWRASAVLAIVAVGATTGACSAILGLDEKPFSPDAVCGPTDGGYNDITDTACWSTYALPKDIAAAPPYAGASFDGRYAYFASNQNGRVVRYDSRSSFVDNASWTSYAPDTLTHAGVVFDGRYMYFVPNQNNTPVFLRYDTTMDFQSKSSWNTFRPKSGGTVQYVGGAFDGRYVYFAPNADFAGSSGAIERYDTQQTFANDASWSTFDTSQFASSAAGYYGAVFDGRHVYFVPSGGLADVIARYDSTADFALKSSWALSDLDYLDAHLDGFRGGMFDGKYLYLVPVYASEAALRYDVAGSFTAATSWTRHVPAPKSGPLGVGYTPEFVSGAFDGRYLYYVPTPSSSFLDNGLLARQDREQSFATDTGWTSFDTFKSLGARAFGAAVFDGRYLYLAPAGDGPFVRFDAKDTASQPALPHYFGSFY